MLKNSERLITVHLHSYIMQTHMQGQTCCILPSNSTWGSDMVAYIRITTWAWRQIEICRPYVFSGCVPGTVVKLSLLGTYFFANTPDSSNSFCFIVIVWLWLIAQVQGRISLQTDPRSKIKAYVSHLISSVRAKIQFSWTGKILSWLFWTINLPKQKHRVHCFHTVNNAALFHWLSVMLSRGHHVIDDTSKKLHKATQDSCGLYIDKMFCKLS